MLAPPNIETMSLQGQADEHENLLPNIFGATQKFVEFGRREVVHTGTPLASGFLGYSAWAVTTCRLVQNFLLLPTLVCTESSLLQMLRFLSAHVCISRLSSLCMLVIWRDIPSNNLSNNVLIASGPKGFDGPLGFILVWSFKIKSKTSVPFQFRWLEARFAVLLQFARTHESNISVPQPFGFLVSRSPMN